jgi:signal transduction histidine kinase
MASGWPISALLALALAGQGVHGFRRRSAINRALHELRRPLQGLALTLPGSAGPNLAASLDLAIAALGRVDAAVNGGSIPSDRLPIACRALLEAAVARWRGRAALSGGSLELRLRSDPMVIAEPGALAQAIDNLIVNALEHGGPAVTVEAAVRSGRVRLAVVDSGVSSRSRLRRETPREAISRLTGGRRRGHGLDVVREVAASHGGRFALQRSERGSVAVLELPLAPSGRLRAA